MNILAKGQIFESNKQAPVQEMSQLELTDEELYQLNSLLDIIGLISVGRKKNEEEANALIKLKLEYTIELCQILHPLLFWLDFAVERESRLQLFKNVYQTIKDVKDSLPPRSFDLDLLSVVMPILVRTAGYLENHSPTLNMLKFLDFVLKDAKECTME